MPIQVWRFLAGFGWVIGSFAISMFACQRLEELPEFLVKYFHLQLSPKGFEHIQESLCPVGLGIMFHCSDDYCCLGNALESPRDWNRLFGAARISSRSIGSASRT